MAKEKEEGGKKEFFGGPAVFFFRMSSLSVGTVSGTADVVLSQILGDSGQNHIYVVLGHVRVLQSSQDTMGSGDSTLQPPGHRYILQHSPTIC